MKKNFPKILLISFAVSTLTACGGGGGGNGFVVNQEDIPPLDVRQKSVYTDDNQVDSPKGSDKDVFSF